MAKLSGLAGVEFDRPTKLELWCFSGAWRCWGACGLCWVCIIRGPFDSLARAKELVRVVSIHDGVVVMVAVDESCIRSLVLLLGGAGSVLGSCRTVKGYDGITVLVDVWRVVVIRHAPFPKILLTYLYDREALSGYRWSSSSFSSHRGPGVVGVAL